jgi:hypothetical protein
MIGPIKHRIDCDMAKRNAGDEVIIYLQDWRLGGGQLNIKRYNDRRPRIPDAQIHISSLFYFSILLGFTEYL